MTEWIIRFRRPLIKLRKTDLVRSPFESVDGGWKYVGEKELLGFARVCYWRQKRHLWSTVYEKADRYKSFEKAEARAFTIVVREPTLLGEVEIVEYAPVSKPRRS